jgi:(p)ppGpp synthase/HD superfamily hydrolase
VSNVEKARDLAHRAHAGQVDKAGHPYIEHVARVAAAVSDDPEAEAVAWLHDVLEDCHDFVNANIWEWRRLPEFVTSTVHKLSRNMISGEFYYAHISKDPIALRVKLADIADNSDEARLELLDPQTAARLRRKYANARKSLGAQ